MSNFKRCVSFSVNGLKLWPDVIFHITSYFEKVYIYIDRVGKKLTWTPITSSDSAGSGIRNWMKTFNLGPMLQTKLAWKEGNVPCRCLHYSRFAGCACAAHRNPSYLKLHTQYKLKFEYLTSAGAYPGFADRKPVFLKKNLRGAVRPKLLTSIQTVLASFFWHA